VEVKRYFVVASAVLFVLPATGGRNSAVVPNGLYVKYQELTARYFREHRYDDAREAARLAYDEARNSTTPSRITRPLASLCAIAGELVVVKEMQGLIKAAHVTLAGVTVLSSWSFIQVMFALHYAHDYYAAVCHGHPPGLAFPNDEQPDYGDFFYFASVIGTSGQTADVSFISKPMRRIGSVHCILAYLFNTTVLALLINIGASLF